MPGWLAAWLAVWLPGAEIISLALALKHNAFSLSSSSSFTARHKDNVLSASEYCRQLGNISLPCVVPLGADPFAFRNFFMKSPFCVVILGGVGIVGAVMQPYLT